MPLPDDVGTVGIHGFDLDHKVRPDVVVAHPLRIYACLYRLLVGLIFPGDQQDVSVGHRLNVVVMALEFV